jgi:hypothetical protein
MFEPRFASRQEELWNLSVDKVHNSCFRFGALNPAHARSAPGDPLEIPVFVVLIPRKIDKA